MRRFLTATVFSLACQAHADCVANPTFAEHYVILSDTVFVLYGGVVGYALIQTLTPFPTSVPPAITKPLICDYDPDALEFNGIPIPIEHIKYIE